MSGGTVSGVCAETSHEFYVNSSDTASQLDVWVGNHGLCNVAIEVATPESALFEPMNGVSAWAPGDDFVQTIDVPPHVRLWFSCADVHSGESVPPHGPTAALDCSFDWELSGMKEPTIFKMIITEVSVDPLPFVLGGDVYLKLHLADAGPEERVRGRIRDLIRDMSPQQKQAAGAQLKAMQTYVNAAEHELGKI